MANDYIFGIKMKCKLKQDGFLYTNPLLLLLLLLLLLWDPCNASTWVLTQNRILKKKIIK